MTEHSTSEEYERNRARGARFAERRSGEIAFILATGGLIGWGGSWTFGVAWCAALLWYRFIVFERIHGQSDPGRNDDQ